MPPSTRSGKTFGSSAKTFYAGPVNSRGLPVLPDELLLLIISFYYIMPIPFRSVPTVFHSGYLDRGTTLFSLSQTCRSLRSLFVPIVWQRLEVCASRKVTESTDRRHYGKIPWQKELATELVKQCEILTIRDLSLATYVRIVNVIITNYSINTVIQEFARTLSLFPNLETLQIVVGNEGGKFIKDAFEAYKFPSVKTLAISLPAVSILRSCPEVKHFTALTYLPWLLKHVQKYCRHIETLGGPWTASLETVKGIIQTWPDLKQASLGCINPVHAATAIRLLSSLEKLHTIKLYLLGDTPFRYGRIRAFLQQDNIAVEAAQGVLRCMTQVNVKKLVVVEHMDGRKVINIE